MSIYPERDREGKLTGTYRVEAQLNGKRLRGKASTIEDAETMEEDFKYRLASSEGTERSWDKRLAPRTLWDLYKKAENSLWSRSKSAEQSYARCEYCVNQIGKRKELKLLDTQDLEDFLKHLTDTGKSPATCNRYLSAFSSLLKYAQKNKWLKELPVFPWQKEGEHRIRWITHEEEKKLYGLLTKYSNPTATQVLKIIKVGIRTGMRLSEIRGLEPQQVEHQWVRLWKTKTDHPRSIPILGETYMLLQDLLKAMPTTHQIRHWWDKAKHDMGLDEDGEFVFHATRHTCATRLLAAKVPLATIRDWLGHMDFATTLRYAHISNEMLMDALYQSQKDVVPAGNPPVPRNPETNMEQYPAETTG